jgi:hypothetical protein
LKIKRILFFPVREKGKLSKRLSVVILASYWCHKLIDLLLYYLLFSPSDNSFIVRSWKVKRILLFPVREKGKLSKRFSVVILASYWFRKLIHTFSYYLFFSTGDHSFVVRSSKVKRILFFPVREKRTLSKPFSVVTVAAYSEKVE